MGHPNTHPSLYLRDTLHGENSEHNKAGEEGKKKETPTEEGQQPNFPRWVHLCMEVVKLTSLWSM